MAFYVGFAYVPADGRLRLDYCVLDLARPPARKRDITAMLGMVGGALRAKGWDVADQSIVIVGLYPLGWGGA